MIKSLNFLYNEIDLNASQVSPAVWCMLCLVDKEKISDFVEGILSNSTTNNSTKVLLLFLIVRGTYTVKTLFIVISDIDFRSKMY